jgi:hypothetical protein
MINNASSPPKTMEQVKAEMRRLVLEQRARVAAQRQPVGDGPAPPAPTARDDKA